MSVREIDANQQFAWMLASPDDEHLDLDAMVKAWAQRILRSGHGLTRNQRQVLHDISRPDRVHFHRSALARMLDLAPFASPGDATWGAELLRGSILSRLMLNLPNIDVAYEMEEGSNYRANVEQQRFREAPSRTSCEAVCEALVDQSFASRIAADVSWRAIRSSRSLILASR